MAAVATDGESRLKNIGISEVDNLLCPNELLKVSNLPGKPVKMLDPNTEEPLLRSLRQQRSSSKGPSVGQKTLEKLSDAGIRTLAEILDAGEEGLVKKGIRKNFAKQLVDYAKKRMHS